MEITVSVETKITRKIVLVGYSGTVGVGELFGVTVGLAEGITGTLRV